MKTKRKKLVEALDKRVAEIVKKRDKHCVTCGTTANPTAGHLITRAKYSVRWDLRNVFQQCKSCNFIHEFNPHIFTNWYINKFGVKQYQALVKLSNQVKPKHITELEKLLTELKEK